MSGLLMLSRSDVARLMDFVRIGQRRRQPLGGINRVSLPHTRQLLSRQGAWHLSDVPILANRWY
jgi:hypothetical protein